MNISCFGCSFTWGLELNNPQTQSWPVKLADQLTATVENYGQCAASNRAIARKLMVHLLDHTPDAVVVMWTYPGRYEFVIDNNNFVSTHCDSTMSLSGHDVPVYFEQFREYFFKYVGGTNSAELYDTFNAVHQSQLLLEQQNIPYVFCTVNQINIPDLCHPDVARLYNYINPMTMFDGQDAETYARSINDWGISHPLAQAHQDMAGYLSRSVRSVVNKD
jgi:hypothetical protein